MSKALCTFILIAYQETNDIYVSLGSLLCQKNPNWKAIVYHDGPNDDMRKRVETIGDSRIRYVEAEKNKGSWGAYNRIDAVNNMVDTEYLIHGTVQEYWAPVVVDVLSKNQNADILIWNVAHHHFGYSVLDTQLAIKQIDWSNFAIRTSIAKAVGINHPTEFCADGMFIEECVKSGLLKSAVKIPRVLSVKN